jgi:hypothetical protein
MREKHCQGNTAILAAVIIIASCASWMLAKQSRRVQIRKSVEDAVDAWEAEGGAVMLDRDEITA